MKINIIPTHKMYKELINLPTEKKDDYFRYVMMKPFKTMWNTIGVPIKASQKNGYDVVMAASMSGMGAPALISKGHIMKINKLEEKMSWSRSQDIIVDCLERFESIGYCMNGIDELSFGLFIADSTNPQIKISNGYSGFGGIPGYFMVLIDPNEYTLKRLPLAIAHEFNHQIRLTYEPWKMNISLGEYLIIEGLAERFAAEMYGENLIGPWVTNISADELAKTKYIFKSALAVKGFAEVASYMFGDELANIQGYQPVGVPYCAGYAIGYYLIKHYLIKSGKTIEEATLTPSTEMLKICKDFWN